MIFHTRSIISLPLYSPVTKFHAVMLFAGTSFNLTVSYWPLHSLFSIYTTTSPAILSSVFCPSNPFCHVPFLMCPALSVYVPDKTLPPLPWPLSPICTIIICPPSLCLSLPLIFLPLHPLLSVTVFLAIALFVTHDAEIGKGRNEFNPIVNIAKYISKNQS